LRARLGHRLVSSLSTVTPVSPSVALAPDWVAVAARIATEAHAGQMRRDGVTPYVKHPESVAARVAGDFRAEAVAWLHDVLEDTTWTASDLQREGVPSDVVDAVVLLTKTEGGDYGAYLHRVRANPLACRVKIADMLANLADRPTDRQIAKYAQGLLLLTGTAPLPSPNAG
jgi:(p)ppGpp synthase/HD superfamily hydrolase